MADKCCDRYCCDLALTKRLRDCYDIVQDKGVLIMRVRLPFFGRRLSETGRSGGRGGACQEMEVSYEELY